MNFKSFFGFKKIPFENDIPTTDLLKLPGMIAIKDRMDYILGVGGTMVVTGEVGSGKSTSLRWSVSHYHPSQYKIINVTANGGHIADFYRSLCWAAGVDIVSSSRSLLLKSIKTVIRDLAVSKKQKVLILVDEANLLRAEVFSELHLLSQFDNDSQAFVGLVLSGQAMLMDKLHLRSSMPLASRIMGKTHLSAIGRDEMNEYVHHHTRVCGNKNQLFSESAVTAIQQGSGGLLRKANFLARGGLIAAATEKKEVVSAEHIRIASSELVI